MGEDASYGMLQSTITEAPAAAAVSSLLRVLTSHRWMQLSIKRRNEEEVVTSSLGCFL